MKQLERVYLLNVLIYIHEIHSFKKFPEINKKCLEVCEMLRIYTKKNWYNISDSSKTMKQIRVIDSNMYNLFPNIETIECDFEDLFDNQKRNIFNKVKKIRVKYKGVKIISEENLTKSDICILNKVESIHFSFTKRDFSFILNPVIYSNLKRIHLVNCISLNYILNDHFEIDLDEIILQYTKEIFYENRSDALNEIKSMKNYKQIRRKVLFIQKINPTLEKELEKIFDIVYCQNFSTVDCSEFYFEKEKAIEIKEIVRYLSKSLDIQKKELLQIIKQFDFRKCKTIERILIQDDINNILKIEGLTNIQEIEIYQNFDNIDVVEIPSSVSKLICRNFTNDQDISRIIWLNPNIKSLKIIQSKHYKTIKNMIQTLIPYKRIELDEIEFELDMNSEENDLLELSQFLELRNYPNIKKKTLNINCELYHPKYEEVVELRRFMNVNVETFNVINQFHLFYESNINQIPKYEKFLFVYGDLDSRFIMNPNVFHQIESIFCLCKPRPSLNTIVNLELFSNCRKLNIILPYGNITFPPKLEDLTVECHGVSFSYNLVKFQKLKCLKIRNYFSINSYFFKIPNIKTLIIEGKKIFIMNKNEITIDHYEYNENPKRERFFERFDEDKCSFNILKNS